MKTGLEKWKEDRTSEITKTNIDQATNEIYHLVYKCKYCKYHNGKDCLRDNASWEGIHSYLKGTVD